jgi:pre-mRNA-splicing factor CWC26
MSTTRTSQNKKKPKLDYLSKYYNSSSNNRHDDDTHEKKKKKRKHKRNEHDILNEDVGYEADANASPLLPEDEEEGPVVVHLDTEHQPLAPPSKTLSSWETIPLPHAKQEEQRHDSDDNDLQQYSSKRRYDSSDNDSGEHISLKRNDSDASKDDHPARKQRYDSDDSNQNGDRRKRYDSDDVANGSDHRQRRYNSDTNENDGRRRDNKLKRYDSESDNNDDSNKRHTRHYDSHDSMKPNGANTHISRRKRYDPDVVHSNSSDDDNKKQRNGRKRYDSDNDSDDKGHHRRRRKRYDSDDDNSNPSPDRRTDSKIEKGDHDNKDHPHRLTRERHDSSDSDDHGARMSSGHRAGLQTGQDFRQREERIHRKRLTEVQAMVEQSGMGETVHRNISRSHKQPTTKKIHLSQQEQAALNLGKVQKARMEAQSADMERLRESTFARYDNDTELEHLRRNALRKDDPMAVYATRKDSRPTVSSSADPTRTSRPVYKGPPPKPNRFNIRPGYRWDGVDRGNGWEDKLLAQKYLRQHQSEQAYRWSSADM